MRHRGIPKHEKPVVALVTPGVEMDVPGLAYANFPLAEREAVLAAQPRGENFKCWRWSRSAFFRWRGRGFRRRSASLPTHT